MEILELVDKLEAMANQAKKIPMAGRAMVDAEAMLDLIDQIKLSMPRNLQDAQEVLPTLDKHRGRRDRLRGARPRHLPPKQ